MKLSIIVPVYNVEKYLEKCLKSILNIKNIDYEILLINDGSTDNSEKICQKYQKESYTAQYLTAVLEKGHYE